MGLELEAVSRSQDGGLVGCRVRGWRKASPLASHVRGGAQVVAVDGDDVALLSFHVIVRRVRESLRRKITFLIPETPTGEAPFLTEGRANTQPILNPAFSFPTKVRPVSVDYKTNSTVNTMTTTTVNGSKSVHRHTRQPLNTFSPAQLLRFMQLNADDQMTSPLLCGENKSSSGCSDRRLLSPVVMGSLLVVGAVSQRSPALFSPQQLKEAEELSSLKEEVAHLKRASRGMTGETLFLRYQLEKSKEQRQQQVVALQSTGSSATDETVDTFALLKHWKSLQRVVAELPSKAADFALRGKEISPERKLQMQILLNQQLERKMEALLRSQVVSLKQMVVNGGASADHSGLPLPQLAITAGHYGYFSPSECAREREVAKKTYSEKSLWLSAQKTIQNDENEGPKGDKGDGRNVVNLRRGRAKGTNSTSTSCLSPSSFKQHMTRLRCENSTIKDDISKFRLTLRVSFNSQYSWLIINMPSL